METTAAAPNSLGPRFAPEDPTLPTPWKGLIDGSTGLLYYWNPETNVTQYERPAPPLPPGPPPSASTPKLSPIPMVCSLLANGTSQQMPLQHTQPMLYQQAPQMANQVAQQNPWQQTQQIPQHQTQQIPQMHMQQIPYPQVSYLQGQMMPHPHGLEPQAQRQQPQGLQIPCQQVQQIQGPNVGQQPWEHHIMHSQGQQLLGMHIMHQQGQQPTVSQIAESQIPRSAHQQGQQPQGQYSATQQGHQGGFPRVEEFGHQEGKHASFSLSLIQQTGVIPPSHHHLQGAAPGAQLSPVVVPSAQPQVHLSLPSSVTMQQSGASSIQLQQPGIDASYRQRQVGSTLVTNQIGHSVIRPPMGLKMGYEEDERKTLGNEFHSSSRIGGPLMSPQQPMLATLPLARNEQGGIVPAPFMTFGASGFPPEILREMHLAGFSSPTPIQAQTWPVALQGRDIVAIAKTGSGKTLGYLIPAFIHLQRCQNNPQFGPKVLVLAPTRELATQIQEEAIKFGLSSMFSCTCLYGGAPKGPQLKEIEQGADIIVATPGRLNDILEMKKINFCQVSFLVLDEADHMLDMGFEPQIRKIVNEIPPHRQTLMYTATWPKEVRKIAGDLLMNPVQVNIGNVDELAANKSITQHVEVVSPMDRQRRLEQILRAQERGSKIVIFCSTKRLCDQLVRRIGRSFGVATIHGDKSQGERDHVLNQFHSGKAPILVATDVAARGLDIKDIRVVINYDFPTGIEDYVHRIGRTGRAGATGVAYTFFSDQDWKYASDLAKVLEGANQHVPPEIREIAARGGPVFPPARGGGMRDSGGGGRWDSTGGRAMRDGGGFGRRGVRKDFCGGRGGRERMFGKPVGPVGWGRHDPSPHDPYNSPDLCGQYGNQRRIGDRISDQSYSRSPDRVRAWGYDRSRSASRSRSRSCSHDRFDMPEGWNFSRPSTALSNFSRPQAMAGGRGAPVVSGFDAPLLCGISPMSPGRDGHSFLKNELAHHLPGLDAGRLRFPEPTRTIPEPGQHQAPEL